MEVNWTVRRGLLAWGSILALVGCGSDDDSGKKVVIGSPGGEFGNSQFTDGTAGGSGSGGVPQRGGPIPASCVEGSAQASRVVPTVMLVLDGSCSMSTEYPSNGESATRCEDNANSRWSALRSALLDPAMGVVTRLEGAVEFGAAIYGTEGTCPIPGQVVAPARNNAAAIEAQFPQQPPGQFTPTGPAVDQIYDDVLAPLANTPDRQDGPLIILLATDGEPNACDNADTNYQPSIDAVTRAAGGGVTTYVVSLAGAAGEFHDHLQQLANIGAGQPGGTAPLYEPNSPQQLSADLELLIGGAVGCDVALNGTIQAGGECQGKVYLNGDPLACDDPNGFVLADERHIRLQGTACDSFMSNASAMVNVNFPCNVFRPD